jgi:Protein of unknown function (DUF2510)
MATVATLCSFVAAGWVLGIAAAADAAGAGSTGSTPPANHHATSSQPAPSEVALDHMMLSVPLPGLSNLAPVGPGATNGVLTAQTLGSYSSDPSQVEKLFDRYKAQPGFAGWIKTFADKTGTEQVVEIAIRFHDAAEAQQNAAAFVSTLQKGLSNGTRTEVASIPGAAAFTINEASATSGTISIPAQQVQAVVFSDADYFVALHTDSPDGPGAHPIAAGTAASLALQQYQDLSSVVRSSRSSPRKARTGSSSGSTARTVGLAMLGAVAIVIAAVAARSLRHKRRATRRPRGGSRPVRQVEHEGRARTQNGWAQSPDGWAQSPDGWAQSPDGWAQSPDGGQRPDWAPRPAAAAARSGAHDQNSEPPRERGTTSESIPQARSWEATGSMHRRREPGKLVGATAGPTRGARSDRLATSRTNHPSAAIALARTRPTETEPGWYEDPSDERRRRIRYWDGSSWTTHVAEPEAPRS